MYDVALVGSAGFLGSAIGRELTAGGHRVHGFTRTHPVVTGNGLAPAVRGCSVMVWAAGGISPTVAQERPEQIDAELDQFATALRAVGDGAGIDRVVLLSSGGTAYGAPDTPPYDEAMPARPTTAYGRFKRAQELLLAESGVPGTSVRIANAYGPGQRGARGQGVLAIWMRAILTGAPIRIHGSGEVARDYVFIDDVADAIGRIVVGAEAPAVLNVGSGVATTLDELLLLLSRSVGDHPVHVERLPSRGVDVASTWLDIGLARRSIGWEPRTTLAGGIERMWDWAAAQ